MPRFLGTKKKSGDSQKSSKSTPKTAKAEKASSSTKSSKKVTELKIVERRTTELHSAAKNDEFQRLKLLIDHGASVNCIDSDGASPLHLAAYVGAQKCVELLIKSNAKIDLEDDDGSTPLHNACIKKGTKQLEVVKSLLTANAAVNVRDSQQGTPLVNACCSGEIEVVKLLLKSSADFTVGDDRNTTPLHYACYNGHAPVVKALLEKGADIAAQDIDGATPLHHACSQGFVPVLKVLLKSKDININATDKNKTTPLHYAAFYSHRGCVATLLEHAKENFKVDICEVMLNARDKEGSTPLHKAAFKGDQSIVQLFLEAGADIDAADNEGATVLHKAAFKGNSAIMNILLERGAKTDIRDKQGGTALYNACYGGFVKCVQLLLEKSGADAAKMINITDINERGPLHASACFGHWECTSLLVKHNAELDHQDKDKMTPLHLASFNGCNLSMAYLVNAGAKVNLRNKEGMTPLHYAAFKGHVSSVFLLCEKGGLKDPDKELGVTDDKGATPLHFAASTDKWDVIAYLLHLGAEVDKVNHEGLTPLSYAVKNHHIDAAVVLLEHNSDPDLKDTKGNTPRKLSKLRNNPIKKIFNAIGKRPFSPQTMAMLSDFKTPDARKKTERAYNGTDQSINLDDIFADKLGNISTPFTDFGFNFDLNDPAEVAENTFNGAKKLNHHWTALNCLRLLLLVPDDETNGKKMWVLIEQFLHQLVTNGTTKTTKLNFGEFLKEWKYRKGPPPMKKLSQLTGVESSFGLLFPSCPPVEENTDVTFIVAGMEGAMARNDADDGDWGGPSGGGDKKNRVVRKVIVRKKKKKAAGAAGGGADDEGDGSDEEIEVEVDKFGNEIPVSKPGGGGAPLKSRFHDDDSEDEDEGDVYEQYKDFYNFDKNLSWNTPSAPPGGPGGPPPPPPPPGMGGPPPPPPPPGMGGPPPPPPPGMPQKPKLKLRKLNWTKIPKPELENSIFRHLQLQGIKLDIPMLIEYFKIPDEQKKKKKKGAKEEKKQLLDLKRANHIGLLMSMLKMTPKEIGEALLKCKADKFTEDNIKGMVKLLPTDQDVQMLKEFMNAPPEVINTLGPPEQFYLEIMKIPRLESRLKSFLFKSQFASNIMRLKEDIAACHHGVKVMKENKILGLFLELILSIGNFLNQGTATGDCFGFRVDVLPKLKDTKSPVKTEYSLLHYIAYYAEKKKPKMLALPGQLVPISKATAEYVTSISLESAEMRGQMHMLQKELDTVTKINEEAPEKDPFEKVMGKFFAAK